MTTNRITRKYASKRAFVRIKGAIINEVNGRQLPLDYDCRVDTGFDGGLMIPFRHKAEIEAIHVQPSPTTITIADGSQIPAFVCAAHIQQIENHTLQDIGRPVKLVMCGNWKGVLLGMDALRESTILFDGPNQEYTMKP